MSSASVTIGITCFNAEDTIQRAIRSALKQSWPTVEVIIVDDCSTDNSVAIIESAIAGRANARYLCHADNAGPAAARNTILKEANGCYIAFFDDDDESLPKRVEVQVRHLEEYQRSTGENFVVCCASGIRRYPNGYTVDLPAIGSRGSAPHGAEFADYLLYYHRRRDWDYGSGVPTCSVLARRTTLRSVGGFDETLRRVEDNDLAIRLALKGCHFTGVSEPVFIQYSTSAPDKSPENNLEAEQAIVQKHRRYLEDKGRYYYALHWHKLRFWHFKRRYDLLLLEFLGILVRNPFVAIRHFFDTGPRRLIHEWRKTKKTTG